MINPPCGFANLCKQVEVALDFTPRITNMEPENEPLGRGDSYWKPPFSGSMLNFGGVNHCFNRSINPTIQCLHLLGRAVVKLLRRPRELPGNLSAERTVINKARLSSWWFQLIWKICSSNWTFFPKEGWTFQTYLQPPPSYEPPFQPNLSSNVHAITRKTSINLNTKTSGKKSPKQSSTKKTFSTHKIISHINWKLGEKINLGSSDVRSPGSFSSQLQT